MTRLRPKREVHTAANSDGAVLLHSGQDRLYGLNPTAAALWERLRKGKTPDEAAAALAARWGVAEERLRADAVVLSATLVDLGLAEPVEVAR